MSPKRLLVFAGLIVLFGVAGSGLAAGVAVDGGQPTTDAESLTPADQPVRDGSHGAAVNYSIGGPDSTPYIVRGEYGERRYSANPHLFVGETLAVNGSVGSNASAREPYDITLRVNGTRRDSASGRIEPGTVATPILRTTFESPGTATLRVADTATVVTVHPQEAALVTNLSVATSADGETVTVTATVLGGPGGTNGTVTIQEGLGPEPAEQLYSASVSLDPGEVTTIETSMAPPDEYTEFFAHGRSAIYNQISEATVRAEPPETDEEANASPEDETQSASGTDQSTDADDDSPGFGMAVALIGLLSLVAIRGSRSSGGCSNN